MKFLLHWLVIAIALWVTAAILPGVNFTSTTALAIGAIILGLVNALVRPVLTILTLPITILTLGLFYLLVNGSVFFLASKIVPGFEVAGFWWRRSCSRCRRHFVVHRRIRSEKVRSTPSCNHQPK